MRPPSGRRRRRRRRIAAATVSVIEARTDEAREVRDELAANRDTLAAARTPQADALTDGARVARGVPRGGRGARGRERVAGCGDPRRPGAGGRVSTGSGTPSASGFIWPVNGAVVSGFGLRSGRMHEGIDITASSGTPIWAAAAGTVIWAGWLGRIRELVVVDHGNGLATALRARLVDPRRRRPVRRPGRDDRARRFHRELVGAAPALRGAGQRRRGRSAVLPLRVVSPPRNSCKEAHSVGAPRPTTRFRA